MVYMLYLSAVQISVFSRVNKITQLYYVFIQRLLCVSNIQNSTQNSGLD